MKPYEFISLYRVFPRLYVITYFVISAQIIQWFIQLENPTPEQSAFASVLTTGLVALVKFYSDSGVKKHEITCQHNHDEKT